MMADLVSADRSASPRLCNLRVFWIEEAIVSKNSYSGTILICKIFLLRFRRDISPREIDIRVAFQVVNVSLADDNNCLE